MDAQAFLHPGFTYAVVGATTNKEKYGYRVLKDLQKAGLKVFGVNPKYTEIEGIPVFPSVAKLPQKPDVAVVVIPPDAGLGIIDEAKEAGVAKMWFQPGAESAAIRSRAAELGIDAMADGSCIMVERRRTTMRQMGGLHW